MTKLFIFYSFQRQNWTHHFVKMFLTFHGINLKVGIPSKRRNDLESNELENKDEVILSKKKDNPE